MRALVGFVALALLACQTGADVGATCSRGSDCASATCEFARCRAQCSENRDCPSGASCLVGSDGVGACSLAIDLGCESGVGRECASGLVCVADRCERACTSASDCPIDGECRAASSGGVMFCFDPRLGGDAGTSDAGDAGVSDAGTSCAITRMCFERANAACALDCMGRVWCWGQEHGGGLGNGHDDDVEVTTPGAVVDLAGTPLVQADSLACADGFACAHLAPSAPSHAGHVLCWGYEGSGAISVGESASANDLVHPYQADSVQLSGSWRHVCMLDRTAGTVLCFGMNDALIDVAMPDDTAFATPTPPIAGVVTNAAAIGVASYGACVLTTSGAVQCWGENEYGEAGHSPIESMVGVLDPNVALTSVMTTSTDAVSDATTLAVGLAQRAVLAGTPSPTLLTWGGNDFEQLGESPAWPGSACEDQLMTRAVCRATAETPNGAPVLTTIASEGAAETTCGVIASSHHVICWGTNLDGHNGVAGGGETYLAQDREVSLEAGGALDDATGVFVGSLNACATRGDGSLWCWGPNTNAQLARPSDTHDYLAVLITFPFR